MFGCDGRFVDLTLLMADDGREQTKEDLDADVREAAPIVVEVEGTKADMTAGWSIGKPVAEAGRLRRS